MAAIKNNVSFSNYVNGWETIHFGIGKSITLSNGNQYAIIDGIKYKVILRGDNNQELVEIPMKIKYYLFEGKGNDSELDFDYANVSFYNHYNIELPLNSYKEVIQYSLPNKRYVLLLVSASDIHSARMIALKYEEKFWN